MNEVEAPALVRKCQHWGRRSRADNASAAASPPHCQAFLLVEPLGLLAVDHHALPAQQNVQTVIAEPAPLVVGQIAQLVTQRSVIVPNGTIAHALAIAINDTARPSLAHPRRHPPMAEVFCQHGLELADPRAQAPVQSPDGYHRGLGKTKSLPSVAG